MNGNLRKLLDTINVKDDVILEYGLMDEIEVDPIQNTWLFSFVFERPIPIIRYRNFINHLRELPKIIESVEHVAYRIVFQTISDQDLLDYYQYVIDVLSMRTNAISR